MRISDPPQREYSDGDNDKLMRYNNAHMDEIGYQHQHVSRWGRLRHSAWKNIVHWFDRTIDEGERDIKLMRQESDLFLGVLLFILGFLNFHSGRYCDGNTADYLSCTRPVTYYYFTWLEVILVVMGVFFIMLWFMKQRRD